MKIFRNLFSRSEIIKIIVKVSVWLKQFYIILTRGKKRLGMNVFGELAEKSILDDALSVRALLCWTKFGKNLASDYFLAKVCVRPLSQILTGVWGGRHIYIIYKFIQLSN